MRKFNHSNLMLHLFLICTLGGCSHALHFVHLSDVSVEMLQKPIKRVEATGEQFVILGFVTETNYVNQAYAQLAQQCLNGKITGITTRSSSSHGFLSWTNKIVYQAWCLQ